jgi:hypothetical protein
MKILITPMTTVAETGGSITRGRALALKAMERGHTVAFCAGEDINYRPVKGVQNYPAPIPCPIGLPWFIGRRVFHIAKKLRIQQRIRISTFEQVLHLIGAIEKRFFAKDVECVMNAIRDFQPDIVFSEHRVSPFVSARLMKCHAVAVYSAPIHSSRGSQECGKYSKGVAEFIADKGLAAITSVLDLYDWTAAKIVPSSYNLEPMDVAGINYVGPLVEHLKLQKSIPGKRIVAYMGNGTISGKHLLATMTKAFGNTDFEIYIATKEIRAFQRNNIHVAQRFDFDKLLPEAISFISHGGQNSMMQSLLNGVPLIVCPGRVFERQYNAASIERLQAGVFLKETEFTSKNVRQAVQSIAEDLTYRTNAQKAGKQLVCLGGASSVVGVLEDIVIGVES